MYGLEEKKIIIIGASSGIGEKTAEVLSEAGATVILVARRESELKRICDSLAPAKAAYYAADISQNDTIEGLFDKVVSEQGKLDGMVYAAGITDDVPLKYMTYERIIKTFNINYFGFVECVRQISMRKNYNKGMRIVAISSVASVTGEKAHLSYSASKAAIDATVRCLACELWSKGIVLNTVQPAMIRTQMYEKFLESTGEDAKMRLKQFQYAGIGETEDVANAVTFLISPKARFITGTSLPVDGGYTSV